ncbi:MAG TPA: type II toxin-antitoxin system RelE/ParE family toxin [Acidimicrobiia bacterium]
MTATDRVLVSARARKQLSRMDRADQQRIRAALDLLASDPRPPRCVALTGVESVYRVRVGDYRVLYSIDDEIRIISVIRIGHRREVYR